jgi:hypothetical protein
LFVHSWLTLEALNMVQPTHNASGSHAIFGATRPFLTKTSTNEKITIRVEALGTPAEPTDHAGCIIEESGILSWR